MSKYDPLKLHLWASRASETPMTFSQVEELLGFPLPPSAREHPAWWANTGGSHSHARSWLGAGWRTASLDLARERVVFVRDAEPVAQAQPAAQISIALDALSPAAVRLIEDRAREFGVGVAESAAEFLNEAATRRRQDLIAEFTRLSPRVDDDSTSLIREDRDGR